MGIARLPEANRFELAGGDVQVTYQVVRQGQSLRYRDDRLDVTFKGDQLRTDRGESGTLIRAVFPQTAVPIAQMLDLLVPDAYIQGGTVDVTTVAVLTTIPLDPGPPGTFSGQVQLYRVIELTGRASQVD